MFNWLRKLLGGTPKSAPGPRKPRVTRKRNVGKRTTRNAQHHRDNADDLLYNPGRHTPSPSCNDTSDNYSSSFSSCNSSSSDSYSGGSSDSGGGSCGGGGGFD